MRDRLAFLHLPKSAGTSYRAAIAAHYEPATRAPWTFDHWSFGMHPTIPDVDQPILLGDVDLAEYRYLEGHFALDTILAGFDSENVVCILREPRARFLSHYTFWRSWGDDLRTQWLPYDVPREARRPLREYCASPIAAHQADNLVVRLLVGPHPDIPLDGAIDPEHGPALAALAADRMDALGFVDVLERGDRVLDSLETWFGSPLSRERLNETDLQGGPPVDLDDLRSSETLEAIDRCTRFDQIVWRRAAERCGLAEVEQTGDAAFERKIAGVVAATEARAHATSSPPGGPTGAASTVAAAPDPDLVERLPWCPRLIALLRRGPKAVAARIADEIRHRRRADGSRGSRPSR